MSPEGLHVNFTGEEASSEARVLKPAPNGWYHCTVFEIEEKEAGDEAKNPGAPYWAVTLQCIQEGDHYKRRFWDNVMLFNGALYSLAQLMKALGYDIKQEDFEVPDIEEVIGKEVLISVARVRDKYNEKKMGDGEAIFKNEVKGYKAVDDATLSAIGKTGKTSLLP